MDPEDRDTLFVIAEVYLDSRAFREVGATPSKRIFASVVALFVLPVSMGAALVLGWAGSPSYITGALLLLASAGLGFREVDSLVLSTF